MLDYRTRPELSWRSFCRTDPEVSPAKGIEDPTLFLTPRTKLYMHIFAFPPTSDALIHN